ncbi:CynX/NimT family MFS transporter [Halalkalibacter urbisdiaboli]|uniref:CynX/NimT family MFS transporter n=1 Tax=Halalkalibacter urbisdiaboli TaxID=1960589 RepID=UPI000B44F1D7|nr:MFS transporter [Halalkalibacter urbisdiaboli]
MNNLLRNLGKSLTTNKLFLLIGILFVSFNLRPAITAVGPLVSSIREDIGISNGIAGFITTLPLLSFALFSFLAPKLSNRFGRQIMIFIGMVTLTLGILVRSSGFVSLIFIGTALIGVGIAIANVLLPSIIKAHYPQKIGLMTGIYTTAMCVFAAIGSGLSKPIVENFEVEWRTSLLLWSCLAFIAVLVWIPQLKTSSPPKKVQHLTHTNTNMWRSTLAWKVTIFMGLQSFLFYCMIAWLPEILYYQGLSIVTAGWMLSIMQLAGLPMNFLIPVFAERSLDQRGLVLGIGSFYLVGLGSLLSGEVLLITIGVLLIGLGQGASLSLALTLFGLRSENAKQAAELSGMAQTVGYTLAAIGPVFIGLLLDFTHSAFLPLIVFFIIVLVMIIAGYGAGQNQTIIEQVKHKNVM